MTNYLRGLDADTDLTPYAAKIAAAGFTYVGRYLKNLTRAEVDALHAAGLGVWLIFESTATRSLGGHDVGFADGQKAAQQALALGAPDDVCIFTTCDTDPQGAQVAAVVEYGEGFELSAGVSGFYACGAVLAQSKRVPWLAGASGWNGSHAYDATGAWALKQGPDLGGRAASWAGVQWPALGFDYDPNLIARPDFGAWMPPAQGAQPSPLQIGVPSPAKTATSPAAPAPVVPPAAALPPLADAQAILGVTADGIWGPITAAAFAAYYGA